VEDLPHAAVRRGGSGFQHPRPPADAHPGRPL